MKTGDLKNLFISGSGRVSSDTHELWLTIQQQFFDEFGVDIEFEIRMLRMKRLAELRCEYILTGNRKLLNEIRQVEVDMEDWGDEVEMSFFDIKDKLEQQRRYQIDINKVTVIEWYYMLKNVPQKQEVYGERD
jgi:hypothetical protein